MPASEASTPGRASLIDLALTLDCPVLDLSLALDCPWPDNPLLHSHTRKCSRHAHAQLWHAHQPSILILHAFLSALLVTVHRTPACGPLCGVLPHMVHHLSIAKEVVDTLSQAVAHADVRRFQSHAGAVAQLSGLHAEYLCRQVHDARHRPAFANL